MSSGIVTRMARRHRPLPTAKAHARCMCAPGLPAHCAICLREDARHRLCGLGRARTRTRNTEAHRQSAVARARMGARGAAPRCIARTTARARARGLDTPQFGLRTARHCAVLVRPLLRCRGGPAPQGTCRPRKVRWSLESQAAVGLTVLGLGRASVSCGRCAGDAKQIRPIRSGRHKLPVWHEDMPAAPTPSSAKSTLATIVGPTGSEVGLASSLAICNCPVRMHRVA